MPSLSHSAGREKPLRYPHLISAGELGGLLRAQSHRHPLASGCSLLKKECTRIPIQLKIPVKNIDEMLVAVVLCGEIKLSMLPRDP